MQLSKILLPIDFSILCDGAAHYARTLACRFHSELTVAHVFEWSNLVRAPEMSLPPEWYEQLRAESQRMLEEFHNEEFRSLQVRRILLEGDVARTLVDFTQTQDIDLIVMPTHGYGRFRRFILGSVTAKVLHDADCPVLTGVHIAEAQTLEPIFFRNIICAVDFDSAGERALHWAAQFAAEFQARITLVHALPHAKGETTFYFEASAMQLAQDRLHELQKRVGTNAEVIVEPGPVAEVVRNATKSQCGDLAVIGRHENPGFLGRLRTNAYAIIREAPCPVVSV